MHVHGYDEVISDSSYSLRNLIAGLRMRLRVQVIRLLFAYLAWQCGVMSASASLTIEFYFLTPPTVDTKQVNSSRRCVSSKIKFEARKLRRLKAPELGVRVRSGNQQSGYLPPSKLPRE